MQRQKKTPNKEDNTGIPASKSHTVESESPIHSQPSDGMDVSEDFGTEESEVPFVTLYCAGRDSGEKSHAEDDVVDSLNDLAVPATETPLNLTGSLGENTSNIQQKVAVGENVYVTDGSESVNDQSNTKHDQGFSTNVMHDHNYMQDHEQDSLKMEGTGNEFTNAEDRQENEISEANQGVDEAKGDEHLSGMVDHKCVTEVSSLAHVEAVHSVDMDLCTDVEEEMQLDGDDSNKALHHANDSGDAHANLEKMMNSESDVHSGDYEEVGDEPCQSKPPQEQETCLNTSTDAKTKEKDFEIVDDNSSTSYMMLVKESDPSKQNFSISQEECDHHASQGELALSPFQQSSTSPLEEEQTSQELFPDPVSVKPCEKTSEDVAVTPKELAEKEELNMDIADPLLLTDPKPTAQGASEDELSLQMQQSSADSVVPHSSDSEPLNGTVSSNFSLEQQSSLSATVSSGFPTASQQGECSSVSQQHDFTSLAQLTADNLELLESNLQQIVPSSVGRRLYQSMVKVLGRFPEYFEKS